MKKRISSEFVSRDVPESASHAESHTPSGTSTEPAKSKISLSPGYVKDMSKFREILLGTISPRPIALASTINSEGNVNLSPFSFFNVFSVNPPILAFSPSRRVSDNTKMHTLENILEIKEVVINTVTHAMIEQVNMASAEYERGVNEFDMVGLTEIKSTLVRPPRVLESPVSFECRVVEVKSWGTEVDSGNLVLCEVVYAHVAPDVIDENGKVDPRKLDAIGQMGSDYYCRINGENIFELPKPTVATGINRLPSFILNSDILTGNDLIRLAAIPRIPSRLEVKAFAEKNNYNLIWRATKEEEIAALHRHAQIALEHGDVKKAWLLLLSNRPEN